MGVADDEGDGGGRTSEVGIKGKKIKEGEEAVR